MATATLPSGSVSPPEVSCWVPNIGWISTCPVKMVEMVIRSATGVRSDSAPGGTDAAGRVLQLDGPGLGDGRPGGARGDACGGHEDLDLLGSRLRPFVGSVGVHEHQRGPQCGDDECGDEQDGSASHDVLCPLCQGNGPPRGTWL